MFKKSNIIWLIFIINILVLVTSYYFAEGSVHTGIFRALIMFSILPILITKFKISISGLFTIIFLFYHAFLILFSSDFDRSLNIYSKVFLGHMMLIVSYSWLTRESIEHLPKILYYSLSLIIINFFIAQIFNMGGTVYVEDGIYLGGGRVEQTYVLAYILIFLPFILIVKERKEFTYFEIILFIFSLFPLILIGRRGSIIAFLSGFLIILLFGSQKKIAVKIAIISTIVAIITFPYFEDYINAYMLDRGQVSIDEFERISRTREFPIAFNLIESKGVSQFFFGSELYNVQSLTNTTRPLHTDYTAYLIGGGIIGLTLYLSILIAIWYEFFKYYKKIHSKHLKKGLLSTMIALTVTYLWISYSGQYYVISSLTIVYTIFATILVYSKAVVKPEKI